MKPENPTAALKQYWGYDQFRSQQEEIINHILRGNNVIALLPTGGGKSLCYQIPPILLDGICIVITPLVALMQDQVAQLKNLGLKALALAGGMPPQELDTELDNCVFGAYQFLFLSPERLQQELVQGRIKQMKVTLIAVDEAHCISQWGHDFRPAYKQVNLLRELHPQAPVLALTATATPAVLKDIQHIMHLEDAVLIQDSIVRKELCYNTVEAADKLYALKKALLQDSLPAIVYVRSRKQTQDLALMLSQEGLIAKAFHGGLNNQLKSELLSAWQKDYIDVMVATNAFGMGIDKQNVRLVVHYQIPESIESYYQEAGRAGRDKKEAKALLIYNQNDVLVAKNQFVKSLPDLAFFKTTYKALNSYFGIAYGEGVFTDHAFSFSEFCERYNLPFTITYNCLKQLDQLGVIRLTPTFYRTSVVKFLTPTEPLLDYFSKYPKVSMVGQTILRYYGGVMAGQTPIRLEWIAKKLQRPVDFIIAQLEQLERDNMISLTLHNADTKLQFLVPREDHKTIHRFGKVIAQYRVQKTDQLNSMLAFISNSETCRQQALTHYFGQELLEPCGSCDNCRVQNVQNSSNKAVKTAIIARLKESPAGSRDLIERFNFADHQLLDCLQELLDAGTLKRNSQNEYYL